MEQPLLADPDSDFAASPWTKWSSYCGYRAAQHAVEYYVWEAVLNEWRFPDETSRVKALIEIGTWEGGFSLYLSDQCSRRDMTFRTYDVFEPKAPVKEFIKLDVFAHAKDIQAFIREHEPVLVFCDGGNKGRELRTFSEELTDPNSLMAVHDWMTESFPQDVPDHLEMIFGQFSEDTKSMTRFFKLK